MSSAAIVFFSTLMASYLSGAHAHGRMLDPPSRMSAYLLGFATPINYLDHEMNCGGRVVQWQQNGGKCGICGDPWSGPRNYERPDGSMVQHQVITKGYYEGDIINIKLQITANHKGWNEFRICDIARSGGVEANHTCLNENLLADTRSGETRFYFATTDTGFYNYTLGLPAGFTCTHCLLQWKWHCGNDWGCDGNVCGVGLGEVQEEFYACADVAVAPRGTVIVTQPPETTASRTTTTTTTTTTATTTTTKAATTRAPGTTTPRPTATQAPITQAPTTRAPTTQAPTPQPTTVTPVASTKSPPNIFDYYDFIKNNKNNISSGFAAHMTYSVTPTNNVTSKDFLEMVMGSPTNYVSNYHVPVAWPVLTPAMSPTEEQKRAIERLCFSCYGNCRFLECTSLCPNICVRS